MMFYWAASEFIGVTGAGEAGGAGGAAAGP